MKPTSPARVLSVLVLSLFLSTAFAEPLQIAQNPPKLEITASRSKKTRVQGGDWDDKTERISMDLRVLNPSLNTPPLEGYTLKCWVFTKLIKDSKAYNVIIADETPIKLTTDAAGREVNHKTPEAKIMWDNTGAIFGERYEGWIVVVLNEKGEIAGFKCSKPQWEKLVAKAGDLQKGKTYTSQLDLIPQ